MDDDSGTGGIRLQVPPVAAEAARMVLARDDTLQDEPAQRCPACGSEQVGPRRGSRSLALLVVHAFQLPLPFNGKGWDCADCGARWQESARNVTTLPDA